MPNNKKVKCKQFCLSDTAGQSQYQQIINSPRVDVLKEKEHWEGGECLVMVRYEVEQFTEPSTIEGKTNGLPSELGSEDKSIEGHLTNKKEEGEELPSPSSEEKNDT